MSERATFRDNAPIYALWGLSIIGAALLFRNSLGSHLANRDFAVFTIAGKLAVAGHPSQAFSIEGNDEIAQQIGRIVKSIFLYPPHTLFLAVPVSYLPVRVAFWAWQIFSAAAFYLAARPYTPDRFPRVLSILTPAALISVGFGQVGLFFGALWLWAFRGSSLGAALLTFKPHLGFLVAIEAIRRRQFFSTSAIAVAIIGLSVLIFGIGCWQAWWNNALAVQAADLAPRDYAAWFNKMMTPYIGYGFVGWFLFGAAAAVLLMRRFDVFTAATATFLITPYGLHYDMTVVCFGFGLLLFIKWRSMPPWQTFVAALSFLSPLLVGLGTWIVPPILLAGLYIQTCNPISEPNVPPTEQGFWGTLRQRQTFT